jgi:molybdate/tungstate transport system substrate-binding protein
MKMKIRAFAIYIIILSSGLSGCNTGGGNNSSRTIITIFHAGSLSVPIKEIADTYMALNQGIKINLEGAGSVACTRKITELNKPCDIMASADFRIIDELLIPDYTSMNIHFASNSMVIAFTEKSGRSDEIDENNWMSILMDEGIIYGRSDPDSDPCGYRTIMSFKLAEKYYQMNDLVESFLSKDRNMIRPKEVDLIGLLQSNVIDYMFTYMSIARQHNLRYIELPPEVDLSDPDYKDIYESVSVDITGNKPGEFITLYGSEMIYGITILNNAPEKEAAIEFMNYFLGPEGLGIIKDNGQIVLDPLIVNDTTVIPEKLKHVFND